MQSIPTRIPGVSIARFGLANTAMRGPQGTRGEILYLDSGSLCEPHFLNRPLANRTLACVDGEAYVMVVDVRRGSPTFGRWIAMCLSSENQRVLKLSTDIACGWMATAAHAKLRLSCGEIISPKDWQWLSWDDSELALEWPEEPLALESHARRSRWLSQFREECLPIFEVEVHVPSRPHFENVKQKTRTAAERNKRKSAQALMTSSPQHENTDLIPSPNATRTSRPLVRANDGRPKARASGRKKQSSPLILVIGSSGQLGRDLCRHLRSVGTVLGASRDPERNQLLPVPIEIDISRPASLRQVIRQVRPQLIVNASGLTDVDRAEADPRLAQLINATAPAIIAEEADKCSAAIVHYCTDMVFSGKGERPWRETDEPEPMCQYSRTKLIGTEAIRSSNVPHLILRSGWLYSTHGESFIRQTIDMSLYRKSLSQAADHYGSPTSTNWLADVTARLLNSASSSVFDWLGEHGGLFHCAALGFASRAEVAEHVLADCRQHGMPLVTRTVHGVPLAELPSLATRPANCRLDCSRIAMQLGIELPRWQDQLTEQMSLMIDGAKKTMQAVA